MPADSITLSPQLHRVRNIFLGQPYGTSVDWWSLGITVAEMLTGELPFYDGSNEETFIRSVTRERPKFPIWIEVVTKNFLKKLLRKDPARRLGERGDIRQHPFFSTIDWTELEARRVQPPIRTFPEVPVQESLPALEGGAATNPMLGFSFKSPSWAK
ncbi:protein kinase C theta type-like [Hyperolius riggenbachi]|uniref:protein kinase C theta type-like n=1 Tax=Hyperolius riggenbachi TaxID=752182 RepID=UPI0035A3270B